MSTSPLFPQETVLAPSKAVGDGEIRVLSPDRTQTTFKIYDVEALIPADHQARTIWQTVSGLDLKRFYEPIAAREGKAGRAATDPKLLLALWLYATTEAVGSARELERLTKSHDAYKWLCGGVNVNYHTLSDFRVGHEKALDDLMIQLISVLRQQKLVKLKRVAGDGTRVRASAGASSFRTERALRECLDEAKAHLAAVKREAAKNEPKNQREQAARERAAIDRQQRIEKALKELPKAAAAKKKGDKEKARVSTTDPEARVMKMPDGGFRPAYNVQLAADTESRVIVGVSVTNVGSDGALLPPMLDDIERRTGALPEQMLADGGYASLDAIDDATARGIVPILPLRKPKDPTKDPHTPRDSDSEAVAAWRKRMTTDEAKTIYRERAATIETVNADLKQHRGLDQFLVRGLGKVTCVVLLTALAYNILRMTSLA